MLEATDSIRSKYKSIREPRSLVQVWTDGSCNNKTKSNGSYGIVIKCGEEVRSFMGPRYEGSTSARMELLGAVKALEKIDPSCAVRLYCDNQYVVNCIAQGWLKRWDLTNDEIKNIDLLRRLDAAVKRFDHGDIKFIWVKGHADNENNIECDRLAGIGAKQIDESKIKQDTRTF